jgi:hypothetical protein
MALPAAQASEYNAVLKYFNPESQANVTTVRSGPKRWATRSATATLPPVEVPVKIPSSRASLRAVAIASRVDTVSSIHNVARSVDEVADDPIGLMNVQKKSKTVLEQWRR